MKHGCERNNETNLIRYIEQWECWTFTTADGMTRASHLKYCPFCGEKLEEVKCSACSGSGRYRDGECGACNGTGCES